MPPPPPQPTTPSHSPPHPAQTIPAKTIAPLIGLCLSLLSFLSVFSSHGSYSTHYASQLLPTRTLPPRLNPRAPTAVLSAAPNECAPSAACRTHACMPPAGIAHDIALQCLPAYTICPPPRFLLLMCRLALASHLCFCFFRSTGMYPPPPPRPPPAGIAHDNAMPPSLQCHECCHVGHTFGPVLIAPQRRFPCSRSPDVAHSPHPSWPWPCCPGRAGGESLPEVMCPFSPRISPATAHLVLHQCGAPLTRDAWRHYRTGPLPFACFGTSLSYPPD